MLFNLTNWMLRQILADLSDNPALYVGMKGMPQVCQRARRRHNDERRRLAFTHQLFQCSSDVPDKTMLLEIMPVGRRHLGAAIGPRAFEYSTRSIAALFVSRRVFIDENALGLQAWIPFVAGIAQEQGLAAIADEDESIVGNFIVSIALSRRVSRRFAAGPSRTSVLRRASILKVAGAASHSALIHLTICPGSMSTG